MIPIYIPTYGRERVLTLDQLPPSILSHVTVVCDKTTTPTNLKPGVKVVKSFPQGKGGPTVKQAIIDRAIRDGHSRIALLDDDLVFQSARFDDGVKKFSKATPAEVRAGFDECVKVLDPEDVALAGFCTPFFNTGEDRWKYARRIVHALFIDLEAAERAGAAFDKVPTMGDVWFNLKLAVAGFNTAQFQDMAVVDVAKRGEGGESALPGRETRHLAAVEILERDFPGFVVRRKTSSKAFKKSIGGDIDITTYMGRAVKHGRKNLSNRGQ